MGMLKRADTANILDNIFNSYIVSIDEYMRWSLCDSMGGWVVKFINICILAIWHTLEITNISVNNSIDVGSEFGQQSCQNKMFAIK